MERGAFRSLATTVALPFIEREKEEKSKSANVLSRTTYARVFCTDLSIYPPQRVPRLQIRV